MYQKNIINKKKSTLGTNFKFEDLFADSELVQDLS